MCVFAFALYMLTFQFPSSRFASVGRSYFSTDARSGFPLGEGKELRFGYYQSIRPTMWSMVINVDSELPRTNLCITFIHTYTHTYRLLNKCTCKELPEVAKPLQPGLGGCALLWEIPRPALDKPVEPGQVLAGAAFHPWCGHLNSDLCLGRVWHSQWSCPSPSLSQVPPSLLFYLGLGGMPSGEFFSPVVAGRT